MNMRMTTWIMYRKKPTVCNHRLDHLEEVEDPNWGVSSCYSNLECQEECISPNFLEEEEDSKWDTSLCFLNLENIFLVSIEEHNDISFETLGVNWVLNYEILDEEVGVSFANFQEHSLHDSFEMKSNNVQVEL